MQTVAIINQKGGCGKTTTAINLSGILAHRGLRTLLVDLDPQSHCAAGLGVPEQRIDLDIGDAMLAGAARGVDPARLLWRVGRNLDLAPSRMRLAGLEAARGGLADKADRDQRLAMVLARLAKDYDAAIIDCSPSIGLLTFNALAAADTVLIPVETSFFSLQGATKQFTTVQSLSARLHHDAEVWLLPTIHMPDNVLANDLLQEIHRRFADRVAPVVIRRDTALVEAATFGHPIIDHAPESDGAADYSALADWLTPMLMRPGTLATATEGFRETSGPVVPIDPTLLGAIRGEGGAEASLGRMYPGGLTTRGGTTTHGDLTPAPGLAGPDQSIPPNSLLDRIAAAERPARSLAEDIAHLASRMRKEGSPKTAGPVDMPNDYTEQARIEVHEPRQALVMADDANRGLARPALSVQRLLGVRETARGLLFVQPLALGARIAVVGDFNDWSADAHVMVRNDNLGVLELCLVLPPGRHAYRLVIDGRWCPDPYNADHEPSPLGGLNSIAHVSPRPETTDPAMTMEA